MKIPIFDQNISPWLRTDDALHVAAEQDVPNCTLGKHPAGSATARDANPDLASKPIWGRARAEDSQRKSHLRMMQVAP
jgi:hypothetical protein